MVLLMVYSGYDVMLYIQTLIHQGDKGTGAPSVGLIISTLEESP